MGVARRRRFRPVLEHGFTSLANLVFLSCVVMLVYEHPVFVHRPNRKPVNGLDNPTMIPHFHPVLKHGAKPPAAGKGHECPSSFSTSTQFLTFHSRIIIGHFCRGSINTVNSSSVAK
jgi:hypothetical protein